MSHSPLARVLAVIAIAVALTCVPIAIYFSGQARSAATAKLCKYTQNQWRAFNAVNVRFTAEGSDDRAFLDKTLGPYPNC